MMVPTHPVLSCAEAVELERGLLHNDTRLEWAAMTRAGDALARELLLDYREIGELPGNARILVIAGKGHNAGDAFLAVRSIVAKHPGVTVKVLFPFSEQALNTLARRAWDCLLEEASSPSQVQSISIDPQRQIRDQLHELLTETYSISLDGLFGMNFRPPFRKPVDEIVGCLNEEMSADLRAAVDLPSGLSDSSSKMAIRADFTYMTGSAKCPVFKKEAAAFAGRIRYLDIGFFLRPAARSSSTGVLLPGLLDPLRRLRDPLSHKRGYGRLLLLGGSRRMPGAILMAVLAATRSGVGLLRAAVPESLTASFAAAVPEAMWIPCPETPDGGLGVDSLGAVIEAARESTAVAIGPGVGVEPETQALLEEFVKAVNVPLIVDADALQRNVLTILAARNEMRGRVVITPHAGEFARISGTAAAEADDDAVLSYAKKTGFVTVLKGPPFTRLSDGTGIAYGLAGGPVLARGGSGDLLTGIMASLVSRAENDVAGAAARAVVWHGLSADALARDRGQEAVRTTQLLDYLGAVLRNQDGAVADERSKVWSEGAPERSG